jgi:acyl-CoA thioesterase I
MPDLSRVARALPVLVAAMLAMAPAQAEPPEALAGPAPHCSIAASNAPLARAFARTALRLQRGQPVTLVAIGSSSTAGAGATSEAASYPSRLEALLKQRFPGREVRVLNRGVNGEEAADMLARFDRDVIAEHPDLVLWQVGTNTVLRHPSIGATAALIRSGIARLKAVAADVVLIDPQYAPTVIARPAAGHMVDLIAAEAATGGAGVFHRFALMRDWHETQRLPFAAFIIPDGLHMNDWAYDCVARNLAAAIIAAGGGQSVAAVAPAMSTAAAPGR